jgi:ribosome maturation factor RimP
LSIKYYCLILRRGESIKRGPESPILLVLLMIEKEKIKELVLSEIEKKDIVLVEIQVRIGNSIKIVLDSISGVNIDECARISKIVEENFDREIEDFELEVSSYGISQPLILPLHYQKNMGKELQVYLKGGKNAKGILKSFEFEDENLGYIEILIKKKVQLEGKKRKTEIEEINKLSGNEIQKVLLLLDF